MPTNSQYITMHVRWKFFRWLSEVILPNFSSKVLKYFMYFVEMNCKRSLSEDGSREELKIHFDSKLQIGNFHFAKRVLIYLIFRLCFKPLIIGSCSNFNWGKYYILYFIVDTTFWPMEKISCNTKEKDNILCLRVYLWCSHWNWCLFVCVRRIMVIGKQSFSVSNQCV